MTNEYTKCDSCKKRIHIETEAFYPFTVRREDYEDKEEYEEAWLDNELQDTPVCAECIKGATINK